TMITWSRVLAGRLRDPMVGRDLLFGTLIGILYSLYILLFDWLRLRRGNMAFSNVGIGQLGGMHAFTGLIANRLFGEISTNLVFFLTLFLLRAVLKKQWLAVAVWVAGWTAVVVFQASLPGPSDYVELAIFRVILFGVLVVVML